jgi:hypothetical protein
VPAPVPVDRAGQPRAHAHLPVSPGHRVRQRRAQPRHGRPDLPPPPLRLRLQRRRHQVLGVEGRAGGGEGHGGLLLRLRVHELRVPDRAAVAPALAENRPPEVPPGEGEGVVGGPRGDGSHGGLDGAVLASSTSSWLVSQLLEAMQWTYASLAI